MAKRANPSVVGGFVVGGIILVLAAIVVLGAGHFFSPRREFVCFFSGNVNGLKVGAPVKIRGVPIGSVVAVRINLPGVERPTITTAAQARAVQIPVIIELDENQLSALGARRKILRTEEVRNLIKAGLRARLSTESLLTGLLYVDLDFLPDTPAHLVLKPGQTKYVEIPTVPTQFEELQQAVTNALAKLDKVDVGGLVEKLKEAAESMRDLAKSTELQDALVALNGTLKSLHKTSRTAREQVMRMRENTRPLIVSLTKTSDQARLALQQMQATLVTMQHTVDENSPAMYNLSRAAQNLSQASLAIRNLAVELQRNPSVLVRGKYMPDNGKSVTENAR